MKKSTRISWYVFLGGIGFVVLFFVLVMVGVIGKLPVHKQLESAGIIQATEVYATDGTLMGKYYHEHDH